ncbi:MAG: hypothetical protein AB1651_10710 [Pseudomonadota bacterium]
MRGLVLILCLVAASADAPALADQDKGLAGRLPEAAPGTQQLSPRRTLEREMSPSDAARQVQQRYGGRVLAVQINDLGYRVKVLKDGEVRIYQVIP